MDLHLLANLLVEKSGVGLHVIDTCQQRENKQGMTLFLILNNKQTKFNKLTNHD